MVRVLANISAKDIRSVTGSNLMNMEKEIKMDPLINCKLRVKSAVLSLRAPVPSSDGWRLSCLQKYLAERYCKEAANEEVQEVQMLIDSLCSS